MEKIALKLDFIKNWVKNNRNEAIALFVIIAIASYLRLYKIGDYMTFLGDEGRDAIIVRRLLTEGDPILIGPGTSIGNMFLGPLYYYFITPGLLFANFSPIGPSIQIAIFGVFTVYLVWLIAKEWFGKEGALVASFLYAISPTTIVFSRSSWNPNIMPFFALLAVYAIWKIWQKQSPRWLIVASVSMAFVLQSHYLGLLLAPTLGVFWLWSYYSLRKTGKSKVFIRYTVYSLIAFAFLMSPLVIFDFRHNFINYNSLKLFFTERQTTVSARPWNALPTSWPILQDISTRLLAGRNEALGKWAAMGMLATLIFVIRPKRFKVTNTSRQGLFILFTWLGFALLGLGLFKQQIYDHYYGFFFPAPFLLVAAVVSILVRTAKIRGWWLVGIGVLFLSYFNLINSPILEAPNFQLTRTVAISNKIEIEANGKPFNLAVIAERNYEDAYQYFLERDKTKVIDINPQKYEETVTDQLFVVCELPRDKCDPTHNPKAQIANFGWSEIKEEWNVQGHTIFRLTHAQ